MAVSTKGVMPLYLHTITTILKEMRIEQQETGASFNYWLFKSKVLNQDMTQAQLMPLHQRLDTLESFMPSTQTIQTKKKVKKSSRETKWSTIVCDSPHSSRAILTNSAWSIDHCRPVLPLRHRRGCVCLVQHVPFNLPRGANPHRKGHRTRRGTQIYECVPRG